MNMNALERTRKNQAHKILEHVTRQYDIQF